MTDRPQLRQTLSFGDLIFIVVGTVIGSGIWLTPGAVARAAGTPGFALVAWIAGGILSLLGALTFAVYAGLVEALLAASQRSMVL